MLNDVLLLVKTVTEPPPDEATRWTMEAIAGRLNAWLALPENEREAARAALVETVGRLWSWEGVARGVLAAAPGKLDGLPCPGN